ncbi:hypothetical protein KIW84_066419 [Lathyrus oleraceus]|uniref:DUF7745 domain-containing protein n=1 Tax=Pisum sativum TaxID=3888 RepID=A0A9D5ADT5_PEA|nr:hypothetical protein KIW84_066419 [Pisum sativum]
MGMGPKIKPKDLAMTLGISPEDLLSHYKQDRGTQGLRRSYLEGVAQRMDEEKRSKEDDIEDFILHGGEASYIELLRKVTQAWEKVHVKDNKPKRKDTSSKESYTPRIKERACLLKMPFVIVSPYIPYMSNPITMSTEEVDRLKATIARLEQDKEILEHSLYYATYEKNQISVGVNFENLNGKLKEAQAEGQRWKRTRELAVWEQQER